MFKNKKYKYMKPKTTCLRVGCDHTDCENGMKDKCGCDILEAVDKLKAKREEIRK